ncbi:MAG: hypothetical protein ACTHJT_07830, partial [Cytophaga sp.]|uniref:hypothetical protein n=1 Tax=Cytophaga sp. TaxID=29535 RepID=UPI003F80696B
ELVDRQLEKQLVEVDVLYMSLDPSEGIVQFIIKLLNVDAGGIIQEHGRLKVFSKLELGTKFCPFT